MLRRLKKLMIGWVILTSGVLLVHAQKATEQCHAITEVLQVVNGLKPGASRAQLEKAFLLDGGMQFAGHTRYVFRTCHYIKLDVIFAGDGIDRRTELLSTDKIVNVSKPYLDFPVTD